MFIEWVGRQRWPLAVLRVVAAIVLYAVAGGGSAMAAAAGPARTVDLAGVADSMPLVNQLSLLEDNAQRDPAAALGSPDWHPVNFRMLSRGFTRSVLWLTGEVYNGGRQPVTRWLSVGPDRLEDVRFYAVDGAATPGVQERYRAGVAFPFASRAIKTRLAVFPVTLAPGQHLRFLVRVQSRSAITLDVRLWSPDAYRSADLWTTVRQMLLSGTLLSVAALAGVLGLLWRDRVFVLLAVTVVFEVIYQFAYEEYVYRLWLDHGGDFVVRLPSITGNLTTALFTVTVMTFVGFQQLAGWKWIYRVLAGTLLAGAVWSFLGDYRVSASVTVVAVFFGNIVWVVSMFDGWRRGLRNAPLMLIAFAPDCVSLFLRIAVMLGGLSGEWIAGTAQTWDSLSVLLMMLIIAGGRVRQTYRSWRDAQQALLDTRTREAGLLEQAVETRTRELQGALLVADDANRAKGEFLARVSHDLRTPLTSIIGFADLIQAAGREDADRGRVIRRSADHMLGMVNDLIDYAAGEFADTPQREPVYLHALLEVVAQHGASLAARSGNAFRVELADRLPPVVEMDGRRMQQIIGNLLDNATKFTANGLIRLIVDASEVEGQPGLHELDISVSDNGCGIAAADQQRIFEPFARLEGARHRPGIGLGLAIVKQWVERMGGALRIDSEPGRGTTIGMTLHARAADEAAIIALQSPETALTLPAIDGNGRRVLVAEDTAEIRQLLHDDLLCTGFEVETVHDGALAIERLAAQERPAFHLVLTDHMMPGADGDAVLAAARRHARGVPVIALSATPQKGAYDASLLKPVSLVDLRNTIARVLGLPRAAAAAADEPVVRPAGTALDEARHFVELGAVSELIDWCGRLAKGEPECAPFARQVARLARLGEIADLKRLLHAG